MLTLSVDSNIVEKVTILRKQLDSGSKTVLVGYGNDEIDYAVYVHEDERRNLNYTTAGTGPKFLEDPAVDMASSGEIAQIVADELSKGNSLSAGLYIAGQELLERSQPLVPTDTGALKGSGFVRRVARETMRD